MNILQEKTSFPQMHHFGENQKMQKDNELARGMDSTKKAVIYIAGPSTETRGGIGYVIGTLMKSGLADSFQLIHIVTHQDGSRFRKIITFLKAIARFIHLRIKHGSGLLHIHSSTGPSLIRKSIVFHLGRAMGCPVIFQIHSGEFIEYYQRSRWIIRHLINRIFHSSERIVTLTLSWKRKIETLFPDCAPVEVVANPVNHLVYAPTEKAEHAPPIGRLLYLGAIIKAKGVYDLVEAFKLLKSQGMKPHITIAGNREIEQMKQCCKQAGLEAQFEFPGWVSETEKLDLLRKADLLVLPSYGEGLPLCVLEAMACGLPVIYTDAGGLADLVAHGENGLVFKPGDIKTLAGHITTLIGDHALRHEIGERNHAKFRNEYTSLCIKKKIGKIYSDLLIEVTNGRY